MDSLLSGTLAKWKANFFYLSSSLMNDSVHASRSFVYHHSPFRFKSLIISKVCMQWSVAHWWLERERQSSLSVYYSTESGIKHWSSPISHVRTHFRKVCSLSIMISLQHCIKVSGFTLIPFALQAKLGQARYCYVLKLSEKPFGSCP